MGSRFLRSLACAALAACRAYHPPFPDVPVEPVLAPPPKHERRAEYFDHAATHKRREWHVLVHEGGATVRHGEELEWWPGGGLKARRAYDHDRPTGEWSTWYADGVLRSQCTLGSDELAPMRWWHSDGTLATEGRARDGLREGPWRSWHANGVLESEGEYRASRREGPWRFWGEDGALLLERSFRAGVAVERE